MAHPWVDDDVINELCPDLTQKAARARRLRKMGLTVAVATDGSPKVLQANLDRVFGGVEQARQVAEAVNAGPERRANRSALKLLLGGRGG